ncbi:MAG: (d)CMP kinase [Oscillospiraceae bacterium]|jgi:cytidylate kinase|nr:(d)CMP kinase [Oscillospiraceae bacterium]
MFSVAIDGPSGAGKSTAAKKLAEILGVTYVDTGALYRALALHALGNNIDINCGAAVAEGLKGAEVGIKYIDGVQHVFLGGKDVSAEIRGEVVSAAVSTVARYAEVRAFLLETQRRLARENSVIMDGRDIGTFVLPGADVKIFLTAAPEIRAKRRFDELVLRGEDVSYQDVLNGVIKRDRQDENRGIAPLRRAEDAVLVDSSGLDFDETVQKMLDIIRGKI